MAAAAAVCEDYGAYQYNRYNTQNNIHLRYYITARAKTNRMIVGNSSSRKVQYEYRLPGIVFPLLPSTVMAATVAGGGRRREGNQGPQALTERKKRERKHQMITANRSNSADSQRPIVLALVAIYSSSCCSSSSSCSVCGSASGYTLRGILIH